MQKMVCTAAESTTVSGQAIDPTNKFTPELTSNYLTDIMTKLHNTEIEDICRKDPLLIS